MNLFDLDSARGEAYQMDFEERIEHYKKELNTPKKVIIVNWNPSQCPSCKEYFDDYEPVNDGYYTRAYALERCPYCGQKLKWDFS